MSLLRKLVLGGVAAAALSFALPSMQASAADAFRFSFDVGNVRSAYNDGYWDNGHKWHNWRNSREHRAYREAYQDHYVAERHTRFKNSGWRDSDGDGVPDRLDDHPNNPRRK